jgi:hypothetical protein
MNTRSFLLSAGIAGAITGVLSGLPIVAMLNCLLCAWLWVGSALGVWLYNRRDGMPMTIGQGAGMGVAVGLVAALVASALSLLFGAASMQAMGALPPEMMGDLPADFDLLAVTQGLMVVLNFIAFPIFGLLGGLIGASIFKGPANSDA